MSEFYKINLIYRLMENTNNKKEKEVSKELSSVDMKKTCKKVKEFFKKFWGKLKEWKVLKWIGFLVLVISSLWFLLKTIFILLLFIDSYRFQDIVNYFYGIKLFDYISHFNFYLIFGGGYLINISIFLLLFFVGSYWYSHKKYLFDKKRQYLIILSFVGGLLLLGFGLYRSMPRILVPFEKIQKVEMQKADMRRAKEERIRRWKENGWIKEREDFDKGFWERGNYNGKNLKENYYRYYYSDF